MTTIELDKIIDERIERYNSRGNIDVTSKFLLQMMRMKHPLVKEHSQRVALLGEAYANTFIGASCDYDPKAIFYAGLFHDIGKIFLPYTLFEGQNITTEEYALVKQHSVLGFESLKEHHLFVSIVAGCHHNMYDNGYGLTIDDFPKDWKLTTIQKVLSISSIISVCDFIDAYNTRKTTIKDGSTSGASLDEIIKEKYKGTIFVSPELMIKLWNKLFT